ncbi:hypothetical protein AVEN_264927-1 [Araneus ventricosus]|uniref:Uncharacterized protein n=1 Tax=Araneus ventricosus TaxID=182803 RepID=A0A4Y2GYS5_ARAVE|nr:hypothetical protein AVEN_264927-1 [Araneus ventricosus]
MEKNVATKDEAWVYLKDCKKQTQFVIMKEEKKNLETGFKKCKESFSKGIMIAAGFSYNGKVKVKRVDKMLRSTPQLSVAHVIHNLQI